MHKGYTVLLDVHNPEYLADHIKNRPTYDILVRLGAIFV